MDPNVTWGRLVEYLNRDQPLPHGVSYENRCEEICELCHALLDWLSRDGFLPISLANTGLTRPGLVQVLGSIELRYTR